MRDDNSPYRMSHGRALPKFGSAKNPFAVPPKADLPEAAPQSEPELRKIETPKLVAQSLFDPPLSASRPPEVARAKVANSGRPKPVADVVRKVSPAKTEGRVLAEGTGAEGRTAASPESLRGSGAAAQLFAARVSEVPRQPKATGLADWARKLNPLKSLFSLKPGAKSTRVRPARAADQPELFLKSVKVARNDLSDADLEIVPVRSAASARVTLPAGRANVEENTAWGRLASRFFGADNTVVR